MNKKEQLDNTIVKAKQTLNKYVSKNNQWRFVSLVISLITSAAVPILLFIAYMNDHNFFSYDFFIDGVFGMKIFFVSTLLLLLVGALITWGFLFITAGRVIKSETILDKVWTKENKPLIVLWGIVCVFVWFMICILIYQIFQNEPVNYQSLYNVIFGLVVMFVLAAHLLTFLYSAKCQVFSSLMILVLTIFAVLIIPQYVSVQVNSGLKAFGMGGNLPVKVELNNSGKEPISGKLKLITPKNIYLSIDGNENVTASFPLSDINYQVENKKKD